MNDWIAWKDSVFEEWSWATGCGRALISIKSEWTLTSELLWRCILNMKDCSSLHYLVTVHLLPSLLEGQGGHGVRKKMQSKNMTLEFWNARDWSDRRSNVAMSPVIRRLWRGGSDAPRRYPRRQTRCSQRWGAAFQNPAQNAPPPGYAATDPGSTDQKQAHTVSLRCSTIPVCGLDNSLEKVHTEHQQSSSQWRMFSTQQRCIACQG